VGAVSRSPQADDGLAPASRFGDALCVSEPEAEAGTSRLASLRVSARGWHGVQLAVIGLVAVQATNGERWCGALADASPGSLSVSVDGNPVVVSLRDVAAVSPVDSC
jgi:hypothetical protein